ncbi:transcriptional regulator, AraC family [Teredinibacter turnerae T7901]|uniref:Transcriptional regulator, AraC family n=2 Tax=Teredinibacter turnerae TaxID=2426 RepID=C5BJJ0_TERTT|nr:AraC family transcriptional regulator [Teredinibacter turnerae]ACR13539.1 transcriptional regulator, AraC family [Teredinibacter turnerae T7901]
MNAVIFNFHDIGLLLRAFECAMFGILLVTLRETKRNSNLLLAGFLLANACVAMQTLVLWGDAVKYQVFSINPNIVFLLGFTPFLPGPLLLLYTQSLVYSDFKFRPLYMLHIIPSVLAGFGLYFLYFSKTVADKKLIALDFKNYGNYEWHFNWLVHSEKYLLVAYGCSCIYTLLRYRTALKSSYSDLENIDFSWLLLLVGGFLVVWCCFLVSHLAGNMSYITLGRDIAIAGNYLMLTLITALVFYSLAFSDRFDGIASPTKNEPHASYSPQYVRAFVAQFEASKPYLNQRLTLEGLAADLGMHKRDVSGIINQHLDQNFHMFVNRYRIQAAKALLDNPEHRDTLISEISGLSGFNSKAAFNRFFKKFTGKTPTAYRLDH